MNGRAARTLRREERKAVLEAGPLEMGRAAYENEQLTRERVGAVEAILRRGFFGRLWWLISGR